MLVRSAIAAVLVLAAAPVLAQSVDPARVLAARGDRTHKAYAASGRGFADRTARISSIMGAEVGTAAPLHLPTKPVWVRPARREADATASLR